MSTSSTVAPMRIAEVATKAAEIIDRRGWCQHYLFDSETGAVCQRGAVLIAVGLPPLNEMMFAPSLRHDRRRHEFISVDAALADFLALPGQDNCNCGGYHDNRASEWENGADRTQTEVVNALRGLAAAQLHIAEMDYGTVEPDFSGLEELLRR